MKNNLQKVRWEKNWSQKYLSMRSKVPQSVISEIENGNETPSVLTALKLAKALSVKVEDIFMLWFGKECVMQEKGFVKIMGLKFDVLEGLTITTDANRSNIMEAAEFAQKRDDNNTIWIVVPCSASVT